MHLKSTKIVWESKSARSLPSQLTRKWRSIPLCNDWGLRPTQNESYIHARHAMCLATVICSGWAYGSIIKPLPLQGLAQILESNQNPGSLLGRKPYHYAMIEAWDPPRMDHTSMSDICNVFGNSHMQWMGIWIHHQAITTARVGPDFGIPPKSWVSAWP